MAADDSKKEDRALDSFFDEKSEDFKK